MSVVKALKDMTNADDTAARQAIADGVLTAAVTAGGLDAYFADEIMDKVMARFTNKKNPAARETGIMAFGSLFAALGPASEPFMLEGLMALLEICSDKVKPVRVIANKVANAFVEASSPSSMRMLMPILFDAMKPKCKWETNLAAIQLTLVLVKTSPGPAQKCLPEILPILVGMMWDPKDAVKDAAVETIREIVTTVDNRDVKPFIPNLISAMQRPEEVEECVYNLGSTCFVQTVDGAALSLTVPLLLRGFAEKKTSCKRTCAVIVDNMAKLVEVARDGAVFLPAIMPLLEDCMENISNPECREKCEQAYKTLKRLEDEMVDLTQLQAPVLEEQLATLFNKWDDYDNWRPNEWQKKQVTYMCNMAEMLIETLNWEPLEWHAGMIDIYCPFITRDDYKKEIVDTLMTWGRDNSVKVVIDEDADDDAEVLCNCKFSLAYGTKILLNSAILKLKRGRAYGLLGPNDCGKSTLMKAIANEQVDGFPPRDEVLTVYVESDIQGDMVDLPVSEFVMCDSQIQSYFGEPGSKTKRDVHTGDMLYAPDEPALILDQAKYDAAEKAIQATLSLIGFTTHMITGAATALSGGWRMKLALARAMIQKADIMLMDEPTNHLDVVNVAWVTDYICNLKGVTCIIVSHDATLLDKCCSYIINFEDNLKLKLYKGNLTDFIKIKPEAKCYFELKSDKVKFKFPQPGMLEGVNTKGRKIMEMVDVEFQYPGNPHPTVTGITVRASLSSRVACIGRNGAGKSTIIKLLTGELEPGKGKVWKHPNCRTAYVAQHAFHHIEQHLDKTPNQYILWRYESGDDKEALAKSTVVATEEELKMMKKPVEIKWTDEDGKSHKENRVVEKLSGGRKQGKAKDYEYEVKWEHRPAGANSFLRMDKLVAMGFEKAIKEVDEKVAARAGAYSRPLTSSNVEKHLCDIGLVVEYGTHSRMAALSGGQKVKVVIAGSMWMQPHMVILDEPTNYLDRESLGALADAIKIFEGGVIIISHNAQFCGQLCPETWVLDRGDQSEEAVGRLNVKGDAEWMKNVMKQKVEIAQITDMVDAMGNTVTLKKKKKKTLSRKEQKQKQRLRALKAKAGEPVSEDSDEDW